MCSSDPCPRIVVFAHTPPPAHGQSLMIEALLNGMRESYPRIELHHINVRLSDSMEDIGGLRPMKLLRLLAFCLAAIWARFRHRASVFYYVPAPAKRGAIIRDWIVMILCRPFFPRLVIHWHAYGLGAWVEANPGGFFRKWTRRLLAKADLAIVLSEFNRGDAEVFAPKVIRVVPNGIADPLGSEPGPLRNVGGPVHLLYLAHCTRDKGLFDTVEALRIANHTSSSRPFRLTVGGRFMDREEETSFRELIAAPDLAEVVDYRGFLSGEAKHEAFLAADFFVFPTRYIAEAQPVNLIEAMAYDLPVVTTRWRGIPSMFPPDYPGLVPIASPAEIARCLLQPGKAVSLRAHFLRHYALSSHLTAMAVCLGGSDRGRTPQPSPGEDSDLPIRR